MGKRNMIAQKLKIGHYLDSWMIRVIFLPLNQLLHYYF